MSTIPEDALRESWDSAFEKTVKLSKMIQDSGQKFDKIVVIPRGSYYPVNIIGRELGFKSVDYLHASIGSYEDGETQAGEFKLGQMPTDEEVRGKRLLIIDEVCDKGRTLDFLTRHLKEQGAKDVRTAVLHNKPNQSETGFVPDWYVEETDQWIVYPWELHEKPA